MAGLCNWAEAMCTYHEVAKVVEPKIQVLRIAESELRSATKQKDAAVDELRVVQAKLDAMQVPLAAASLVTCNCQHRSTQCNHMQNCINCEA